MIKRVELLPEHQSKLYLEFKYGLKINRIIRKEIGLITLRFWPYFLITLVMTKN